MRNFTRTATCGTAFALLITFAFGVAAAAEEVTNSIGMKLVRIEPGQFTMGQNDSGAWDERPVHSVTITEPFYMGTTEVTNAQYERFDPDHARNRGEKNFAKRDDEAVLFVSWHDAVAFCNWLSEKEGKPYRLPTEAEWEYACRAETTTPFWTGDTLSEEHHKHQKTENWQQRVDLDVGKAPANPWGLFDMHGNVEEWCLDWYGRYPEPQQTDPVGPEDGDFKVTRGGSHNTEPEFLRSANRLGTLPEDKHWLIGFRVVISDLPDTPSLPPSEPPLWACDVSQEPHDWPAQPNASKPYFEGPIRYVKIPDGSMGPMFSAHNHCPAIAACPNGDLMAIWYSTIREPGRELAIVAARLRRGEREWEPAAPFWDAPDRNDHASDLWWDGDQTLYHFNGLSTDATWARLALVMRTSTDNGVTWSKARILDEKHELRNMPIAGMIRTKKGHFVLPCDAVTGGRGGSAVNISKDGGETWTDPGYEKAAPSFKGGTTGAWIAGIHAGVVELEDGRLLAFGRGNDIDGHMPQSVSSDGGETWTYSASPFPPVSGGQRLALLRLREGPILMVSFTDAEGKPDKWQGMLIPDAEGTGRRVYGMFAALSFDEGATWPVKKLITAGGPARDMNGGGNTRQFVMDDTHAEPRGYLAATQTPDKVIHLISSALHYRFNLAWLQRPMASPTG